MEFDTVELVMEVEATFDITLRDAEAERIVTVGQLFDFIWERVDRQTEPAEGPPIRPPCLGAAAFYRLRRALVEECGADRGTIRPAALLDELIPESDRRRAWSRLAARLGWRLPGLTRPEWLSLALFVVHVSLVPLTALAIPPLGDPVVGPILVAALIALVSIPATLLATRPLATRPGSDWVAVDGLVRRLVERQPGAIRRATGVGWTRDEVWETLRSLIAQLGVPPEQVTPDVRFVDDLGAD